MKRKITLALAAVVSSFAVFADTEVANDVTIVSAETDDATGILSGKLKFSYFNGKKKFATKSLTVGGVVAEGMASGTAGAKNQPAKKFVAEIGE